MAVVKQAKKTDPTTKLKKLQAKGKLSKNAKKKASNLKRKALQMSYCWYCEREFEDDKVLLSHQKAKHFKCPHCPRRLNTAGGLAVHIDQVHKLGTDRIENAIPGRDTFDVEIYGMEGIPPHDLAEWKKRKEIEAGISAGATEAAAHAVKNKIDMTVIPQDELKKKLKAHKDLMEGKIAPSAILGGAAPPPSLVPPPFSMPGMMSGPPAFGGLPALPGLGPPPPGLPMPPPGFPMSLPPGMPLPPPGMLPPLPGLPPFGAAVPGLIPGNLPPPPPFAGMPPMLGASAPTSTVPTQAANGEMPVPDSSQMLKADQKLLFGDNDTSPEEKRAKQPRYAVKNEMNEPAMSADGPVGEVKGSNRPKASDLI